MDTDNTERTPETAEDQPKQETPASGQDVFAASSRGDLIRQTRMSREPSLSCTKLAELIGVSTATMSLIERDKYPVNDVRLAKIAKILSIPFDVLKGKEGVTFSKLTPWQQHLQEQCHLDDEELSALLQIAIDAKLYRYDAPDTQSLGWWERFYMEMRNFLPRTTVQDRMLQDKTVLQRIGRRDGESPENALNRYLSGIDALVEPIIQKLNPRFKTKSDTPFSTLYLAEICKTYRIKIITIENTTNTDVVKQQLFSLNLPEAIGSFISLSDDPNRNTAIHVVDNAPDGIRRYLIIHDKRRHKAVDSNQKLWRAITEIILGPDHMREDDELFPGVDREPLEWLNEESIARVEFPPSVLSRLIEARMSPVAKEDPFVWMDSLYNAYDPQRPQPGVFRALTRQTPFPLCHLEIYIPSDGAYGEEALVVERAESSPAAAERGMVFQKNTIVVGTQLLFGQKIPDSFDMSLNHVVELSSSMVANFRLPETLVGTKVRVVARHEVTHEYATAFLVPDFTTNTPEKDPYADW